MQFLTTLFTSIFNFFTKEDLKRTIREQQVTITTLEAKLVVLTKSNDDYRKLIDNAMALIDVLNIKQEDIVDELNEQINRIKKERGE